MQVSDVNESEVLQSNKEDIIVSLKDVNKSYYGGLSKVLNNITVDFRKNRVTGFLGLNGAGKTTTMKIITTYLKPDTGKVLVDGIDVLENPSAVRKIVGYLPENFPLYEDLKVNEFLKFVADVKGVDNIDEEVFKIMQMVGLLDYKDYFLRELSKGYKQRVGLAQAILGNPKVIILDEPTQGLDPFQIIEIRKLIKDLSSNRSVILSTHIMQEVEAICDDIVIIHKGNILLSKELQELAKQGSGLFINYVFKDFKLQDDLLINFKNILGEIEITLNDSGFSIKGDYSIEDKLYYVNKYLFDNNYKLVYVDKKELRMEDLFVSVINNWEQQFFKK
ncbi:MAG: ATP-binding cassette domain-containing protein [bacterium]